MSNNNLQINIKLPRVRAGFLVALTLILFAAYAFRLWNLGTQSLWHDEAWSVFQAYTPQTQLDPNYPPAYTIFLGGWIRLAGDEVWTMRYFTLLWGVITVAVGAFVTRRWFGETAGILTAIFLAASPTLWVFSQEIRSYVMMPLFTILLLALADQLIQPQQINARSIWIRILLIEIFALYTHNLGVPLTAWLNVTIILAFVLQRQWRHILLWMIAQVGLFIVYLPWLLTQRPTGTPLNTPPPLGFSLVWNIWQSYFTGIKSLLDADPLLVGLTATFVVVTIIGIAAALVLRPSRRVWLSLSQVVLLPTFELIIILAAHIDFHPRYFILGIPSTLILTAFGWSLISKRLNRPEKLHLVPLGSVLRLMPVAIALLLTIRMVTVLFSNSTFQHDDFRAMATYYAKLSADSAIIIPYGWEPTLDYYSRKMDFRAKIIGIPLHSSEDTLLSSLRNDGELAGINRAELFTWYQLPADVRGAYPCWLSTMYDVADSLTFSGVTSTAYVRGIGQGSNTSNPFRPVDFISNSAKIRLQDAWAVTRYNHTCLITWWALSESTRENLSVALRVLNPHGWEIARKDAVLLNDKQHPTSLWKSGATESMFSLIELPDNAIGDQLPVTVTVYSAQEPSGLDVIVDNQIKGKQTTAIWTVNPPNPNVLVKPTTQDTELGNGLYLHAKDVPDNIAQLRPGDEMRVTLEWWRTSIPVDKPLAPDQQSIVVTLTGKDNSWSVQSSEKLFTAPKALTWHSFRIPVEASGVGELRLTTSTGDSLLIGEYNLTEITRVFTAPVIANPVDKANFAFTDLIGVDVPRAIHYGDQFRVQLTWKATATPQTAYTVFVHLLDTNGQVVAQSDSQPTDRPTTSWLEGEYIIDAHLLNWNREYHGSATLEVGLYDAATGNRVSLEDGSDHIVLPVSVNIK